MLSRQEREEIRLMAVDRELRHNGRTYHKERIRQTKQHKRYTSSPCKHLMFNKKGECVKIEYIHRHNGELVRTESR